MSGEDTQFYLVRLELDSLRLFRSSQRLPAARELDVGYLVHCQMAGMFGDAAPRPFLVKQERGRAVEVWGYSGQPRSALHDAAKLYAAPDLYSACDWSSLHDKPLPLDLLTAGRRVGFELRACPVVRRSRANEHAKAGSEVDLFLARLWETGETPDRGAVYREWLASQLQAGGASLESARLRGFRRIRLVRRRQDAGRTPEKLERPEAFFEGTLRIEEPARFRELLRRGVGRHRAFGFGMLLLRPPKALD